MLALIAALTVLAQTSNSYLDEGKRRFDALDYSGAIEQLKVARQVPGLTEAQTIAVMDLLARSEVAEGRRADAQKTFEELLVVALAFEPDRGLSPKILEVFDAAKAHVFPPDYFKLELQASPPGRARLRLIDPWTRAATFELNTRLDGEPAWRVENVSPEVGVLTLVLEAPALRTLEWYVTARSATGDVVGTFGSALEPQHQAVPDIEAGPTQGSATLSRRLERWGGWAFAAGALGAAIAGGVMQGLSISEGRAAIDRTKPPGNWVDTARATHSNAVRDAGIATGLFIGAGVFVIGGAWVFLW